MGKKIVSLRPLAQQYVHPEDSVLGEKSRANLGAGGGMEGEKGLTAETYAEMIRAAFQDPWWNSEDMVTRAANSVPPQAATTGNPRTAARALGSSEPIEGASERPT